MGGVLFSAAAFFPKVLLYALHSDSDLDTQAIYTSLSTNSELEKTAMSVAEKLKAEGRQEGRLTNLRENVLEVLEVRFGEIPAGLREAISGQGDESKLRQLHRLAIQCAALEAFSEGL